LPDKRIAAEDILIARCDRDWRDIEALDCLGSERALTAMASVLKSKDFSQNCGDDLACQAQALV
jgi:hypothetical protein